ncbi:MAG: AsmA family protein [Proteobacteria bacterium]|nr:AsmA family protein [Pseudomonadota bacterium]
MSKTTRIALFVVGGGIGLAVFAAAALLLFMDANVYKHRLEKAASDALGMEVRIDGQLWIGFFPGLLVTLEDVHLRNGDADVASAREARLEIALLPLIKKKVRIEKIALIHPRIFIERTRGGMLNVEKPEAAGGTLPPVNLAKVTVSDGTFLYSDEQSGEKYEAEDCSLDIQSLLFSGGKSPVLMKSLSFTADLACGKIRTKNLSASDLKIPARGKDGVFNLEPVTMTAFGAQGTGDFQADFTGAVPRYYVHSSLPQFPIEEFFKTLSPEKIAEGLMDFSANLSMEGKTVKEMKETADGEISLRGENLTLNGRDLDEELSRFESSQNFNLVDMGSFFLAGPVGLAVTKGYSFASIFQGPGGHSNIRTLISDWKVEHGVAQAQDVAMATNENRIALRGELDFVNQRFNDVTVALIDTKGCATALQKIHGSFQEPVVEKPNILKSLAGPALKLLEMGRDLFSEGECEVFYAGSVAPP